MSTHKCIGIFGGTFDPVHFGHLRSALEIHQQLNFNETRFIPSNHPPHRIEPFVSAEHRLNMLRISLVDTPFILDQREIQREGPSYSVDTLVELRAEFPDASLCMIIGSDAFLSLPTWHQWEKLLTLCNIIVISRQGWNIPESGVVFTLLKRNELSSDETLQDFAFGKILPHKITNLEISGSNIRSLIQNGYSPKFLLPSPVWHYIQQHQLYGYTGDKTLNTLQEKVIR